MPKITVNLTDTQIRCAANSYKKLINRVQIKISDPKGLFFDKKWQCLLEMGYARSIAKNLMMNQESVEHLCRSADANYE